jgi:4-hydroxy-tetrahydrodipicolinate synthase
MSRPVAIYHNPGTTHFAFGDALVARLSELPIVQAVKNPLPTSGTIADELARLRRQTPDGFAIGYSGDWGCVEALLAGADAWYSVLAGLFPEVCVELTRAAMAGDAQAARAKNDALVPLWELFKELGSIRVMYAAANIRGISGAQPPLPILPLADRDRKRVHETLDRLDLR